MSHEKLSKAMSIKVSDSMEDAIDYQMEVRGFSNHGQYFRWLVIRDGESLQESIEKRPRLVSSVEVRHE